ncbi:DUF6403 family protein [Micromonospora matsumotoense]|uniref:DUF6403 family protein n=1 Tax=Micromonospora matsumotoense TaxID=121616 RepID=UPI003D9086BC
MAHPYLFWLAGAALLVGAGVLTALLPHRRAREEQRRTARSAARAAIDSAAVSRDAARGRVPEAERLLTRAESLVGGRGGADAARAAAGHARQADRLWREHR